ncbi:Bug family tripartite tricarboxylate transporter substrate binding protein [Bordetella genomosp. 1]|uniref:ABC transporter substrate-binding protein n=1 Tax=Bordetella genomosp. 1 TaxID=1395607 RepID=A0ABX4EZ33_9BORD|nr:tripartite tricarboxylate transporter substrate binding protein [Bordetella genomosp. 1]MDQ8031769.1 tripartite tricarboxylate transporter substrate binding protein [Bordetella sp.]OZI65011.1 ABC transporter substrate-binding protein [Bordetella genomosp. 1]
MLRRFPGSKHQRALAALWAACSAVACLGAAPAQAAWPEQPVRIVVPFTPGGATDAVARMLASKLAPKLGQSVIVENRPGASTVIGAEAAARAQPNGYTLMLSGSTTYSVLPALKPGLPFDPIKSYEHVAIVALAPVVLLAKNDLPVKTAADAARLARERSGSGGLMYGTFGPGSAPHLTGEMFAMAAGARMTPVPYKGSAQLVTAMIGGEVDLGVDTVSSAAAQARAGKVRALAVTGNQRMAQLPDVPTFNEAGLPNVSFVGWYGLVAPAGTPADVMAKLGAAVEQVMADPEVRKTVSDLALEPVFMPGPQFSSQIASEVAEFRAIGERAGISME